MSGDRRADHRHLQAVEVHVTKEPDQLTDEISRLFEVAGRENDAIRRLDECVADLHEVARARQALHNLPAPQLRAALERRRRALGGQAS